MSVLNGNVDRVANSAALKLASAAALVVGLPLLAWLGSQMWTDTRATSDAVIKIQGAIDTSVQRINDHDRRIGRVETIIDGMRR